MPLRTVGLSLARALNLLVVIAWTACGSSASGPPADASSGPVVGTIYSGVPWIDTSGNLVNAHGVGFIQVADTYYMVGEQRSGANDTYSGSPINGEDTFTGVSMYSTKDFMRWTFVGTVVRPIPGTVVAPPYYGERPKILYNASTGNYVIYIKMLTYTGNPLVYTGYYAVLTSSTISGPYTYNRTLNAASAQDFQVFQDTDGTQYLAEAGATLYQFAPDGLSLVSSVATGIQTGEGVSLYEAAGTYFWQSSQGSYWHANDNSYSTATSLTGPWELEGNFAPSGTDTWQSQDTAVVPITGKSGTTYVYVGDRWVNGDLPASTLVVQPLAVSGSSESILDYNPIWNLDVSDGTWSPVTPSGVSVNDDATGTGPNQFNYDANWTSGACGGCYEGDSHSASAADSIATVAFTGTQILLYSSYDNNSGIMGVTLLDRSGTTALTPEMNVSLRFDAAPAGNYMVYASPAQPAGSYVLKIRITGLKDLYSAGVAGNIDRVLIMP
jgi:hypothetical protein